MPSHAASHCSGRPMMLLQSAKHPTQYREVLGFMTQIRVAAAPFNDCAEMSQQLHDMSAAGCQFVCDEMHVYTALYYKRAQSLSAIKQNDAGGGGDKIKITKNLF